ncbi:WGxxGxxG family protein [Mycobacterium sp.]|uniref:WGxxGxxG family protein n=1 Tax=Mycobacterium sp. TaxID=1785 RepID=UPI003C7894FF
MRKPLVIGVTSLALLFGGAGVANATVPSTPVPASITTTLAQDDAKDDGGDNGLWGLAGLLGLAGLAGLLRRRDTNVPGTRGGITGGGTTPRA